MYFNLSACLRTLLLNLFLFPSIVSAQFASDSRQTLPVPLSGQVESGTSTDYLRLRVQLWDMGCRNLIADANLNAFGAFDVQAASGSYELRIVNWLGAVLHSQSISIPHFQTLRIPLGDEAARGPARFPVSIARLQHKVPPKADKEYRNWLKSLGETDRPTGIAHLLKAIAIDPQFFEAANDLGVFYLQEKRLSEAYEMFQRASTIDAGDPKVEANLAYVLLLMHRYPEAEEAARSSVRVDSLSGRGRFLLAVSLLEQKKSLKEAMFHLTKARDQFAPAQKLLLRLEAAPPE